MTVIISVWIHVVYKRPIFICSGHEDILLKRFHLISAYLDSHLRDVLAGELLFIEWIMFTSLDRSGRQYYVCWTIMIKEKGFDLIQVYASNGSREKSVLFFLSH